MENVIQVQNLRKTYPQPGRKILEAVKGVSFEVVKGEIFGILGPNGAGKTTTLEILECIKPQTSGQVFILGLDNTKDQQQIKSRIGVQLQSADYLPYVSLSELLDLFASIYHRKADKEYLLGLVDLLDKRNERVRNLSGGQKQRFTIASSLVNEPEILFLDEPTTGLDPTARRKLWEVIKKINQQGITIILTTHYMEEAEFLCQRVAIMDKGEVLKIDEPQKLISQLSDGIRISFLTNQNFDLKTFERIPGVTKVISNSPKIIMEINDLNKVSAVIEQLKSDNIVFSGFMVKTASLEDVYLKLTGKEYQG